MKRLAAELDRLRLSLNSKHGLRLGEKLNRNQLPQSLSLEQAVYLHYAYYTVVCSVHNLLAFPWLRTLIGARVNEDFRDDVVRSAEAMAKASREAVLMTEHVHFAAHTPVP